MFDTTNVVLLYTVTFSDAIGNRDSITFGVVSTILMHLVSENNTVHQRQTDKGMLSSHINSLGVYYSNIRFLKPLQYFHMLLFTPLFHIFQQWVQSKEWFNTERPTNLKLFDPVGKKKLRQKPLEGFSTFMNITSCRTHVFLSGIFFSKKAIVEVKAAFWSVTTEINVNWPTNDSIK